MKNVDKEISLIKMDIEGGEEHILKEVLQFAYDNNVAAYISFHLSWWSEEGKKNFAKEFAELFSLFNQKPETVVNSPFTSLVFSKTRKLKVYYGIEGKYIDVTEKALQNCLQNNILTIPKTDGERGRIFGDPIFGVVKHIKIGDRIYSPEEIVRINYETGENIDFSTERTAWFQSIGRNLPPEEKLKGLQDRISLQFGSFNEEGPEQLMATKFILETDSVLELGANIGRNTCIIASLLNDDKRFVTLECCEEYANQLKLNRDANKFNFSIEVSALSRLPLVQKRLEHLYK